MSAFNSWKVIPPPIQYSVGIGKLFIILVLLYSEVVSHMYLTYANKYTLTPPPKKITWAIQCAMTLKASQCWLSSFRNRSNPKKHAAYSWNCIFLMKRQQVCPEQLKKIIEEAG
jgi:hypothetical protein